MNSDARKTRLIEEVLTVKSDAVLSELEAVLSIYNNKADKKPSIYDFAGVISKNEADEMKRVISVL